MNEERFITSIASRSAFGMRCPLPATIWSSPGGQGKTRLAAEFCAELIRKGWRCGFLTQTTEYKDWHQWTVSNPTLVVIDHVASRAEDVRKAICSLSRSPNNRIKAPLRILMLERTFDEGDAWVSELVPYESPKDYSDFFAYGYRVSQGHLRMTLSSITRRLDYLGDNELRKIVSAAVGKNELEPSRAPDAVVSWLKEIDSERRPLFLILAVRAFQENPERQLRGWNRVDILEAVLHRDFYLWQESLRLRRTGRLSIERKLFDEHLTIIAAATITGRTDEGLSGQLTKFGLGVPEKLQPDWLRVVTGEGSKGPDRLVAALKPDIIGECFVMERCAGEFGIDAGADFVRGQTRKLFSATLAFAAWQTLDFIRRCIEDFPNHKGLELFTSLDIPEGDQANIGELMDYFVHFGRVAEAFVKANRKDLAEKCSSTILGVSLGLSAFLGVQLTGQIAQYLADTYFNRGLLRTQLDRNADARVDLENALQYAQRKTTSRLSSMSGFQAERTAIGARRLLAVVDLKLGNVDLAQENLDHILANSDATAGERAEALLVRAEVLGRQGNLDGSISDLQGIIAMDDAELTDQKQLASSTLPAVLLGRSIRHSEAGKFEQAREDLDTALEFTSAETHVRSMILVNRSALHMREKRFDRAEEDCTEVINEPLSPIEEQPKALLNRAQVRKQAGDLAGAVADINRTLELAIPGVAKKRRPCS